MKLIWYGTASISIETERAAVLFDPFLPLKGSKIKTVKKDFDRFENILITHGHVDHISSLPDVCQGTDKQIYCTKTPLRTLRSLGLQKADLNLLHAGDTLRFGDLAITAFHASHIHFDLPLILATIFSKNNLIHHQNAAMLYTSFRKYPENGEILAYLIEAEGKQIFLMGSLGLDPAVTYPADIDVLILPYQGRKDLLRPAVKILKQLRPELVILDHFDNTFPPFSREIDTRPIEQVRLYSAKGKMQIKRPKHFEAIEL